MVRHPHGEGPFPTADSTAHLRRRKAVNQRMVPMEGGKIPVESGVRRPWLDSGGIDLEWTTAHGGLVAGPVGILHHR